MTTIKDLVHEALQDTGEKETDLHCFAQGCHSADRHTYSEADRECEPPHEIPFARLSDRDFDAGYGGPEGPAFIAFSPKYVYIHHQYDGAESIIPIPRHPEHIGKYIPVVG